jgi:hypothetical protein
VLVTSSIVAARGLVRSLHSSFGFDPRHALLADADPGMAGYTGEQVPVVQKRLIETIAATPGTKSVGLINRVPMNGGTFGAFVFRDETTDLRPSNAALNATRFNVSPEYFEAPSTSLLAGRTFSWHDDKESPRVAVVNRELARRLFDAGGGGRPFQISRRYAPADRGGGRGRQR